MMSALQECAAYTDEMFGDDNQVFCFNWKRVKLILIELHGKKGNYSELANCFLLTGWDFIEEAFEECNRPGIYRWFWQKVDVPMFEDAIEHRMY